MKPVDFFVQFIGLVVDSTRPLVEFVGVLFQRVSALVEFFGWVNHLCSLFHSSTSPHLMNW
jgi:hypothetical protein